MVSPADRAALGLETAVEARGRGEARREADLQRAAEQWLSLQGIWFLHLSPRAREKAGWPDLVFAVAGRPVAIELKSATGQLSEVQEYCLARLRQNGWQTAVCRSLDEVRRVVERRHDDETR